MKQNPDWALGLFLEDPYGSWHLIHNPLISTLAGIVYSGPMIGRKRVKQLQLTSFTFDFCITRFFEQSCMKKKGGPMVLEFHEPFLA